MCLVLPCPGRDWGGSGTPGTQPCDLGKVAFLSVYPLFATGYSASSMPCSSFVPESLIFWPLFERVRTELR